MGRFVYGLDIKTDENLFTKMESRRLVTAKKDDTKQSVCII